MESLAAEPRTNANFITDFHIDEDEKNLLNVKNNGRANRPLITHEQIGRTSFSATLHRVYYGTYQNEAACLVSIDFAFRFKSKSLARYTSATIEVELEKAMDISNHRIRSPEPLHDPKVTNFAPKQVYGTVTKVDRKKHWGVEIPLMFQSLIGLSAGVTGSAGNKSQVHEENRMEIHGNLFQDDDHDEGANGVSWDLQENQAQGDGIFRNFRGAVVVQNQEKQPFWMRVSVKPVVKFSLDPRRLVTKEDILARLFQSNDEPVLLDGKTPLKGQPDLECDDFGSKVFPWAKILRLPKEYESELMAAEESDTDLTATETNK